jgi:hypothetical protein
MRFLRAVEQFICTNVHRLLSRLGLEQVCCALLVLWWPQHGSTSEAHSLATYVLNICRELGHVIQVLNLPWRTFVFLLFEYEYFRLVVSGNDRVAGFQYMTKNFTDSEKLSSCTYQTPSKSGCRLKLNERHPKLLFPADG